MGDLGNGHFDVGLSFDNVAVRHDETAVLSYAIVNSGHSDPTQVEKMLEQATGQLASKGAQAAATAIGSAIGAAVGAEIGTAAVPIIGTALGALAGWLVTTAGNVLFANGDGAVAAGFHPPSGQQLEESTANGGIPRQTDDQPGTDSPHGCGSNSHYRVTWSIAAS
jgi:hypothetical protein